MKAPNHLSKQWQNIRQTTEDLEALSWREATGVGVILGFDNLIAIDIDGVTDFSLMKSILNFLSIPLNYKWIIQSGSKCGYHIILKCNNISFITESEIDTLKKTKYAYGNGSEHSPTFGSIDTNAYYPPKNNRSFNKIEFKWKGNLVLPPSIHVSGNIYSFVNGDPETSPIQIDFNKLFQLKEKYCSLQAEHSEQDGLEIEIPDEMGGEQTIEIKGHITQFVAKSDENDYNYYKKRNESAIIISSCAIRITGMDAVINKSDKVRALIQLSWLILDINNNVLKRKTYNYYKDNYTEDSFENYIAYGLANKIIQSKRAIYHELIFDIGHVCKIISHNLESLLFIKKEIKNSGLYLDSFIDNMPDEIQNQTLNKVIPDEKETIFISTECKTDIYKDYRKIFEIEYEGVLNSLTKLQLMLKIFLKKIIF
ncbi:MAG: bifunctional DNA primase/polymerase [Chitinophagaceae bacterium]|nr:bifunctional DNA primase/polymerase [Chitinophagaceae bacterium]